MFQKTLKSGPPAVGVKSWAAHVCVRLALDQGFTPRDTHWPAISQEFPVDAGEIAVKELSTRTIADMSGCIMNTGGAIE